MIILTFFKKVYRFPQDCGCTCCLAGTRLKYILFISGHEKGRIVHYLDAKQLCVLCARYVFCSSFFFFFFVFVDFHFFISFPHRIIINRLVSPCISIGRYIHFVTSLALLFFCFFLFYVFQLNFRNRIIRSIIYYPCLLERAEDAICF